MVRNGMDRLTGKRQYSVIRNTLTIIGNNWLSKCKKNLVGFWPFDHLHHHHHHHHFYLLKLCQYTEDSTMIQSVSTTYQAHTSTDGNLIVTHRLNKQRQWYNSRNKTTLETSEKFRKIYTHDRASTLRNCTEINTIWQWIPYIDNMFTKEGCPHT